MELGKNIKETTASWRLGEKMSALVTNVRSRFTKKKEEPIGEKVEIIEDKVEEVKTEWSYENWEPSKIKIDPSPKYVDELTDD